MKRSLSRLSPRARGKQGGLLLAEENPGKNDPEGEESCESSGGGDGYHCLVSSEIVMTIVSGQVVTSCLRRCKFFVTQKINPPSLSARLDPIAAKESPRAGSVIPARGDGKNGGVEAVDYLSLRRTNFLGSTTHSVNSPKKAPAAANAIILTTS